MIPYKDITDGFYWARNIDTNGPMIPVQIHCQIRQVSIDKYSPRLTPLKIIQGKVIRELTPQEGEWEKLILISTFNGEEYLEYDTSSWEFYSRIEEPRWGGEMTRTEFYEQLWELTYHTIEKTVYGLNPKYPEDEKVAVQNVDQTIEKLMTEWDSKTTRIFELENEIEMSLLKRQPRPSSSHF